MATKAKSVYGENRTWDEAFFAYGADGKGRVVLVRCSDLETAREEVQRLKLSDARTVGCFNRPKSELDVRKACRERGWKVTLVRGPGSMCIG